MRNVLAVILAAAAAFCGACAWGGFVMDKALTQPEVIRTNVGPLIDDDGIRSMISTQVSDQIVKHLPGGVIREHAKPAVDATTKKATQSVLDDPGVRDAWSEALDRTRAGYTQQVRSGRDGAGHLEMVLDPMANLISGHITTALAKIGVRITDPPQVKWRVSQDMSDISPLMSLSSPVLTLVVTQSEYWQRYAVAAGASLLLGLIVARRRGVVLVTAGFVGLAAGVVGLGVSGLVMSAVGGSDNAVVAALAGVLTEQARGASWPVTWVGLAVFAVGTIIMVVSGGRRRHREARAEFDWSR